jgi:thiol-disulfide isomerase/thioredoxin
MKKLLFQIMVVVMVVPFLGAYTVGRDAIDFTARDINGKTVKLSDHYDKVILLDFWATWCGPCRREIPSLVDIRKTFKDKNFVMISVDGFERRSEAEAIEFVKENNMDWIHIIDSNTGYAISQLYMVRGIPAVFVIQDGKIVAQDLRGDDLKAKLRELLK